MPDIYEAPARCREGLENPTSEMIAAGVEELAFSPVGDDARTAGGRALVKAIIRAAGRATLAAGDGWRPIDTAPKDGTYVLGWVQHEEHVIVRWYNGGWEDIEGMRKRPTHWMPLPAPPAGERP